MTNIPDRFEYQEEIVEFITSRRNNRGIIAPTMGSGKTRCAIDAAIEIGIFPLEADPEEPVLITCPNMAKHVWRRELAKWYAPLLEGPLRVILIKGTPDKREILWRGALLRQDIHAVIVTYETLREDFIAGRVPQGYIWKHLLMDEAHKFRNYKTILWKQVLKRIKYKGCYPITGTPVRKGPQDLWTMLHMMDPKLFSSYWRFVRTWCYVDDFGHGNEIYGVKNPESLKRMLANYLIRHTKVDPASELPEKQRILWPIELDEPAQKIYNQLEEETFIELGDDFLLIAEELTRTIRLRQYLICPKLIDPTSKDFGAGMRAIVEHVQGTDKSHFLIYTPFPSVFPILREYLGNCGYNDNLVYDFRGGIDSEIIGESEEAFNRPQVDEEVRIALCSIKFAQSYSLEAADVGYFLGYEFNPDEIEQAEDRIRRATSEHDHCTYYYISHINTIDQDVLEHVEDKHEIISTIFPSTAERRFKSGND